MEVLGLVVSRIYLSVFYIYNDKGDFFWIFVVDVDFGGFLVEFNINYVWNYDWEDIVVGGCFGVFIKFCIYIGNYV